MAKRRQLILGSVLMSGLSGCGYRLADFEATCSHEFEIRNQTNTQLSVDFTIESKGEPDTTRSITIDSESEKGYCEIFQGRHAPVEVSVDTDRHSRATRVYDDYQGGYIVIVEIFDDRIEFTHMLV